MDDSLNYQLFGDGTMNVLVDGKIERRNFKLEQIAPRVHMVTPETRAGEQIKRESDGKLEIVRCGDAP